VIVTGVSADVGPDDGEIDASEGPAPPGVHAATTASTRTLVAERTEPPFVAADDPETVELTHGVRSF
jgi:hypothetical protein